jgi:hypothetical protein
LLVIKIQNKKTSSTEVRTQAKGFKVPCANHYTIELLSDSLPNLFFKTFWLINSLTLIIETLIINWSSTIITHNSLFLFFFFFVRFLLLLSLFGSTSNSSMTTWSFPAVTLTLFTYGAWYSLKNYETRVAYSLVLTTKVTYYIYYSASGSIRYSRFLFRNTFVLIPPVTRRSWKFLIVSLNVRVR